MNKKKLGFRYIVSHFHQMHDLKKGSFYFIGTLANVHSSARLCTLQCTLGKYFNYKTFSDLQASSIEKAAEHLINSFKKDKGRNYSPVCNSHAAGKQRWS